MIIAKYILMGCMVMRKNLLRIIVCIVLLALFIELGYLVRNSETGILFDGYIMSRVHRNVNQTLVSIMKFFSFLGSTQFYIVISLIVIIYFVKKKNYIGIVPLIFSNLGTYGANELLKHYYLRTRPLKYFLIEQGGYSFPSGHAMVSFTFYSTLTYLLLWNKPKGTKKTIAWIGNFVLVGLIGFSRIYLGVHWPTDIIGGYMAGIIIFLMISFGMETVYKND